MRQEQNRLQKVGRGALEVFLIVLGVLIALGVNEWRDALRKRQTERLYLERLIVDLELNRQIARDFTHWHRRIVQHAWKVYPLVREGQRGELPAMTLVAHAYNASAGPKPVWVDDTFGELKSTGNLALIQNVEVRVDLLRYYRFLTAEDYPFQMTSHEYRESIRGMLDARVQLAIRDQCGWREDGCTIEPEHFDPERFLGWMQGNDELGRQLTRVITQSTRASEEFLTRAAEQTEQMREIVQRELDR